MALTVCANAQSVRAFGADNATIAPERDAKAFSDFPQ